MNVKKAIKKIAALGTGAALMGATVLGAMAADLSNFPEPFVKDGQFNAMIVIGEAAKTPDVIGAVDVATTLQYDMKEAAATSSGGATSVVMSGDSVQIDLSADRLESAEALGAVMSTLGSSELNALADDEFNDADYSQYIKLPTSGTGVAKFYDDDATGISSGEEGVYLKFTKDTEMYEYQVEFGSGSTSDIATDGTLSDFEDKTIRFMGKPYSVINAEITNTDDITIELMGGDVTDVMEEYTTKTYTVNGKDYEIESTYIGDSGAKFRVNGQITDSLQEGSTYTLSDDTEIGVREILENEAGEGGFDIVEFYLGADKMVLKDTDMDTAWSSWSTQTGAQKLEIGDDDLESAYVSIDVENSSTTSATLNGIQLHVRADDNYYLKAGEKLSEYITPDKDVLFGNFDIQYEGSTEPAMSSVKIEPSGDNAYVLKFSNKDNLEYSVPILYADSSSGITGIGGSSNNTLWDTIPTKDSAASDIVKVNDYFIVSNSPSEAKDAKTRVFQYVEYDNDSTTITIEDIADDGIGEVEVKLSGSGTGWYTGDKTIDGKIHQFGINNTDGGIDDDANIWVNMTATTATTATLTDVSGVVIGLETIDSSDNWNVGTAGLNVTFEISSDYVDDLVDSARTHKVNIINNSDSDEVDFGSFHGNAATASGGSSGYRLGDTDTYLMVAQYGMSFSRESETSSPDSVSIAIPHEQKLQQVFVTSGDVSTSVVEGASSGSAYTIAPIQAGIAKLDTEVASSWSNNNVIVVGGPCVNSVAASLLGNPADCTEGFTEGKAMVKLFPQGSKVAMLVAGMTADDTRRATKVVHNYKSYASSFKGSELEVAGTSMSDITVTSVQ